MPSSVSSRLGSAAGWLAPSAAAATTGALAAGLWEALRTPRVGVAGPIATLATIGFVGLLAVPILLVASVLVRALAAGWRPLIRGTIEEDGSAPRLAGWLSTLSLGMLLLAWAAFQGTWLLASWTAFKPLTIGFAAPVMIVGVALLIVVGARPAARLFTAIARWSTNRRRRRGRRTWMTPRFLFARTAVAAIAVGYALWRGVIVRKLGAIDTDFLAAPAAALLAIIAVHAVWSWLGRAQLVIGLVLALAIGASAGLAIAVAETSAQLALAIWGERPLAHVAIERLFDVEALRDRVPLSYLRPAARPGAAHPDILLIILDTVRADRTPPYGGSSDMPTLAELGRRGTVFNWAFAPSNATERSLPTLVTGFAANRIRGTTDRLDPRHVLLAEQLHAAGYATAGFVCCAEWTGLARGFDHLERDAHGTRLVEAARAWVAAHEDGAAPLFVVVHLVEPRDWTANGDATVTSLDRIHAYQRVLSSTDRLLRDAVGAFARRTPIVIVTSDHGEGLGDHGQPFHGTDLYNSQLRVPLVIAGPGIAAHHVAEVVSGTDLAPTILELAGLFGRRVDGRSIADLARGTRLSTPDGGVAFASAPAHDTLPAMAAIVRGRWKLIDDGAAYELYELATDGDEHSNVTSIRSALTIELRNLLDTRKATGQLSPFE